MSIFNGFKVLIGVSSGLIKGSEMMPAK